MLLSLGIIAKSIVQHDAHGHIAFWFSLVLESKKRDIESEFVFALLEYIAISMQQSSVDDGNQLRRCFGQIVGGEQKWRLCASLFVATEFVPSRRKDIVLRE